MRISFRVAASVLAIFAVVEGCGTETEPDAGEPGASLGAAPTEPGGPTADVPEADAGRRAQGPRAADAATSDEDAATDASASDASPADGGTTCGGVTCAPGSSCRNGACAAGVRVSANGTCTVQERPKSLSCPTGMSCFCYVRAYNLATNAPSTLDVWVAGSVIEVLGGSVPQNLYMPVPTPATLAFTGDGGTGSVAAGPYAATSSSGVTTIRLRASGGYVPERFVKYSSADCGSEGQELSCTFTLP